MTLSTNQELPTVYETQVSGAHAANLQQRGHLVRMVASAESQRDRVRGILAESGIDLVSTDQAPYDLGYDNRKFLMLARRSDIDPMVKAREVTPETKTVEKTPLSETLSSSQPTPFVLKKANTARGVDKYLVSRPDQVDTLQRYAAKYGFMLDPWSTEPYIETPGNVNSSYRVVVTSTGLVIASALLYKPREEVKKVDEPFVTEHRQAQGVFSEYTRRDNKDGWSSFADHESEWFLNADVITSNVSTGGSIVPLKIAGELGTNTKLTREQKKVLRSHGIINQETPTDILEASKAIGKGVGPEFSILMGVDFLQDQDGAHYLLEINPFPGTDSILTWWGIDPVKSEGNRAKQDRISDDLIRVVGSSLRDMQVFDEQLDSSR